MYEDFYNLSGKPFQLTPDQRFFFNSKVHNRAMAYLRYGLEQGEGFIVITGAVGTGKTMLVRNLFNELDEKKVMAAQLVTTQVEPDDMLRMVCASFGLAHEGLNKATMLHNLEAIASARYAEGKRVLLVVDEAQNLPARSVEELRMLSNFQRGGKSLFQSFLLGQEEFKRTLERPGMEQVRQRIIASYHLSALGLEETQKYIEFRLEQVGWKGDPEFEKATFKGILEFTGGVPRRINTLCDRLMLFGCLEELHALGAKDLAGVTQEMGQEVSAHNAKEKILHVETRGDNASVSDEYTTPSKEKKHSEEYVRQDVPSVAGVADVEILRRLQILEEEVKHMKKAMQQERKLLRKAVLLQLDMDGLDEID